jgi:type I site-specific restriction endonuclease
MTFKKDLSERDICKKYIQPALEKAGWNPHTQIREEVSFTDGRIYVKGNLSSRGKRKRAERYKKYKGIETEEQKRIAAQDYFFDGTGRTPRYYQQIAINRSVEAIARSQNRILLTRYDEEKDAYREFSREFFDLIVIDECHRGSAAEDNAWREILNYFSGATHIGLTATPKETATISSTEYFGDPIYTYSLKQGIQDGFLAPYKVLRIGLNVDLEGWRPEQGKTDKHGLLVDDRIYNRIDFDKNLVIIATVNKAGRIGTLGTANKVGQPNIAYFGSPQLSEDGTIVMGLGSNRTLKNLEENPLAVFFRVAQSPVTFTTPGYRLYLKVREIQKEGPIIDSVKKAIAEHAGAEAAKMIAAGVVVDVTEIRHLVAMG